MAIYFYDGNFAPLLSVQAKTIRDAFQNVDAYLDKLLPHPAPRTNIYWGLADVGSPREKSSSEDSTWLKNSWFGMDAFVWDIDGIPNDDNIDAYIATVAKVLKVATTDLSVTFSGNGMHFYLWLKNPVKSPDFYKKHKVFYKDLVEKIDSDLKAQGLPGHADPSIFDHNRVMRVPGTTNLKKGVTKKCYSVQVSASVLDWDIIQAAGLPEVAPKEALTAHELASTTVDAPTVLESCAFLRWTREKPLDVREPEGYGALSILGRLDKDLSTALRHYKLWTNSTALQASDPEKKTLQAIERSGPLTCATISRLGNWERGPGCKTCPHYGKQKSPIQLKSEDFIETKETHFWHIIQDKNGRVTRTPAYQDIYRFFKQSHPYTYSNRTFWIYDGRKYAERDESFIHAFIATATENPKLGLESYLQKQAKEAVYRIQTHGTRGEDFWADTEKFANFRNGILDLTTREFIPHTPEIGFRYCLSFDYDANATAPRWEQFLEEIFPRDPEVQRYTEEFMGYCLSGDRLWEQVAVFLSGGGSNGKSKILEMLEFMAGKGNFSAVSATGLGDPNNIHSLNGKLFNSCGETDDKAFRETAMLKALVVGDSVTAKQLYKDTYTLQNRAKLIFSVNDIPKTTDRSHGFFRRVRIIPFNVRFEGATDDKGLLEKLQAEAAGIYNRVSAAYAAAKARRKFTEAATMVHAAAKFKEKQDYLGFALKEVLESTGNELDFVSTVAIQNVIKDMAQDDGLKDVDAMLHARSLHTSVLANFPGVADGRRMCEITKRRGAGFMGIRFKTGAPIQPAKHQF